MVGLCWLSGADRRGRSFESGGLQYIFSGGAQAADVDFVTYSVPLDEESLAILEEAAKLEGGSDWRQ
jgi:hypothetical protein